MQCQDFSIYWAECMIDYLISLGVDHFFVAPGARSIPLVKAIAKAKNAHKYVGIDERSLGFMALGYGKKNQKPGVVVTTSGTAVANLYPSVVEAFKSETPLILLTADRPFELRHCGANQTIDQVGIFKNHIKHSFDLGVPNIEVPLNLSYGDFFSAYILSTNSPYGPVHINVQLREDLLNQSTMRVPKNQTSMPDLSAKKNGLIVVGGLLPSSLQQKILHLAEHMQWPIYADISSNLRLVKHGLIWPYFELSLLNESFKKDAFDFSTVLFFGSHLVSKRFWQWISTKQDLSLLRVSESTNRIDPTGLFDHCLVANTESLVAQLIENTPKNPLTIPKQAKEIHDKVGLIVEQFLTHTNNNEAFYANRLIANLSEPCNLFISSSMPIRDLDQFASPHHVPIDVYANRGASGIDGITSSAVGVCLADKKATIALMGDLAFLHDTNGLMLISQLKAPMLIVVINNRGGGIFQFLPIRHDKATFSPYVLAPHEVLLSSLCKAHHIEHRLINNAEDFDQGMAEFSREKRAMVLEIVIEKQQNWRIHEECYEAIKRL